MELMQYMIDNSSQVLELLIEHIELTLVAVILSILIGIPIGIFVSYVKFLGKPIIGLANIVQAIPSMALLGFAIPFLGIGKAPAVVMVILYSLLPIIKNTYTGIKNIQPQIIEAATGIGLTKWQILTKIQIPLALPVIMAGIRISAVSAVGLMTLAAFVGAGGLGYLVYAGIRSVNNSQILAGAIPACLLALLFDYVAAIIENLVTNKTSRSTKKILFWKKETVQKVILFIICLAFGSLIFSNSIKNKENNNEIILGSMDFTEQEILSHMIEEIVEEKTDIEVNQKLSLGSSGIVLGAIKNNEIDMYIDYTGTIYGSVLKLDSNTNVQEVYDISKEEMKKRFNLNILKDLNFNNTYTLAVSQETKEKYGLETISDLTKVSSDLVFSPTLMFLERKDGYLGLKDVYDIKFKDVIALDGSPRYTALVNKESDVVDAFSTDGLLKKFNLYVLKDDKNFFLPYQAIPVVNQNVLDNYPEIIPVLEELSKYLNDEVMRNLNYKVDEEKQNPEKVAHDFLVQNKLINK